MSKPSLNSRFSWDTCPYHRESLGNSVSGQNIQVARIQQGAIPFLLIGGVHGDEPEGYFLVETLLMQKGLEGFFPGLDLWIIPRLNVDGCAQFERTNKNGVDLNRNMPTRDWTIQARAPRYFPGPHANSEPETRHLISFVNNIKPVGIISAHSWEPMINFNGPAQKWAEHMARYNGYKATDDIGYPTPGSLGTWAGWERKIPTITLEIERDSSAEKILTTHLRALQESLKYVESAQEFLTHRPNFDLP
jgi:protein MpaA